MNVKIIGIVAVVAIIIVAGVGLAMTQTSWYDADWDELPDDTAGAWRTEIKAVFEDGSSTSIPINGNSLQSIPLSLSYSGQVVDTFQYIISVVATDPDGYYDTVEVRALGTPEIEFTSMSPSPVIYTRQPAYPFDTDAVDIDGQPHQLILAEFDAADYSELPEGTHQMRFRIWRGTNEGFQYKLPDQTDWTTASDPSHIYFNVNVDHAGEVTISFVATTNPQ